MNNTTESGDEVPIDPWQLINPGYVSVEIMIAVFGTIGNGLVIICFLKEQKLRKRHNYHIVSLAISDLLSASVGIPCEILQGLGLPYDHVGCLAILSTLLALCLISVYNKVGVSINRYWASVYPLSYFNNTELRYTHLISLFCWFFGWLFGFLPLFGWHQIHKNISCFYADVIHNDYLIFLACTLLVIPASLLIFFYAKIYYSIKTRLYRNITPTTSKDDQRFIAAQKIEDETTKNFAIILLFFVFCWAPLNIVNCIIAFYKDLKMPRKVIRGCVILSHFSIAGNPIMYAYRMKDFRAAMKKTICRTFNIHYRDEISFNYDITTRVSGGRSDSKNFNSNPPSLI